MGMILEEVILVFDSSLYKLELMKIYVCITCLGIYRDKIKNKTNSLHWNFYFKKIFHLVLFFIR